MRRIRSLWGSVVEHSFIVARRILLLLYTGRRKASVQKHFPAVRYGSSTTCPCPSRRPRSPHAFATSQRNRVQTMSSFQTRTLVRLVRYVMSGVLLQGTFIHYPFLPSHHFTKLLTGVLRGVLESLAEAVMSYCRHLPSDERTVYLLANGHKVMMSPPCLTRCTQHPHRHWGSPLWFCLIARYASCPCRLDRSDLSTRFAALP